MKILILLVLIVTVTFPAVTICQEQSPNATLSWSVVQQLDGSRTPSGKFQDAVAVDLDSEGNIYIVDRARHRLVKYDQNFVFVKEIGGFGTGGEQFNDPRDVDAHLTLNIYVADYNNNRIVRFDGNLNYLNEFKSRAENNYYFEMPLSVGVSGQYDMFILEDLNRRIIKFDRFSEPQVAFGDNTENLGQLLNPHQLTVSEGGKIFVSDPAAKAVVVFDYLGNYAGEITHPDLQQPKGVSVAADGTLLVCDSETRQIFFFKNGQSFGGVLNVSGWGIKPQDVVMAVARKSTARLLYVLSPQKCLILKPGVLDKSKPKP